MDANTVTVVGMVLAAVPPTLMAYAALRQGKANGVIVKENDAKTDAVIEGNEKIHTLVNSKMSAALAEIERLKAIVEQLQAGTTGVGGH